MDASELEALGQDLETACGEARAWVRRVAGSSRRVRSEQVALSTRSMRTELEARRLKAAAARRMCVGVFGPSQAGKSYLVSRLSTCAPSTGSPERPGAQSETSTLSIRFGDSTTLNFLEQINPPGDKESTGLVTRFTTARVDGPEDCPVGLRLFSETDLVKVFANSFLLDFDHHNLEFDAPMSAQAIGAVVAGTGKGGTARAEHLDEVTLHDLEDYFRRSFDSASKYLGAAGYWDHVNRLAPALDVRGRSRLFSVLWGGIDEFTGLFVLLVSALEQLGHAADAFAPLSALTPRSSTIIDVDRIKLGLGTAEDANDTLPVAVAGQAARIGVARSTLCALTAELRLQVGNDVAPMFAHTDLLDFPGARSREKHRSIRDGLDADADARERTGELFIRGKVAMLFKRYTDERELTAMLLCMPPSNQEVKDLGSMVGEWVHRTHGEQACERAAQTTALFVVLTKSDADFMRKEGEDDESRKHKWNRRFEASVRAEFKKEGWLEEWQVVDGVARPFANTLWLRNPSVQQAHLVKTEQAPSGRVEIAYAEEIAGDLPRLKADFLADTRVARHFADPARAFDALLELNDGGIGYLIECLDEVCVAATKIAQIEGRLAEAASDFSRWFETFHEAGTEESRERRRQQAAKAVESIGRSIGKNGRNFGRVLRRFEADVDELYGLYLNIARFGTPAIEETEHPSGEAEPEDEGGSIFDLDDDYEDEEPATEMESREEPGGDNADPRSLAFAEQAVQLWLEQLSNAAPQFEQPSAAGREALMFVVEQLRMAVHGQQLTRRIAQSLSTHGQVISAAWEELAELGAIIVANEINALVASLGFGGLSDDERPPVPPAPQAERRKAFMPPPAVEGVPALGKQRRRVEMEFLQDWLASMVQLSLDNLGSLEGREISAEDNQTLGRILARVQPVKARAVEARASL